jgi:hypothetical protein
MDSSSICWRVFSVEEEKDSQIFLASRKKKKKLMDIELLLLRFLRLLLASLLCHGTHLLSSELYQ